MTSSGSMVLDAPSALRDAADARAGVVETVEDPIARAKRDWLQACADGASSEHVQRLYEWYRGLVIAEVAGMVQGRGGCLS